VNFGFETGTLQGWAAINNSPSVSTITVHSGSYSVALSAAPSGGGAVRFGAAHFADAENPNSSVADGERFGLLGRRDRDFDGEVTAAGIRCRSALHRARRAFIKI
jgi:hypothetical protein